jgi:hypothetical protein
VTVAEQWRALFELLDRGWIEMSESEKGLFDSYAAGVRGVDIYTLLRFARRRFRRTASSSSTTLAAIEEWQAPLTEPPEGDDNE